ncbi:unnamed protein product [Ilex paraguariensis]|uniref:Glycosyltransferase n=1 Tax=Ilex paraguariensis TaxID=185542 RepID=A0ABC8QSI1_9AQUA
MANTEETPMNRQEPKLSPHVLIFPVPIQGHINSMLRLAELLCLSDIDVTFLTSDFSYNRIIKHGKVDSRFARYPGFRFETITDGLSDDHPRSGDRLMDVVSSLKNVTGPLFKEMMVAKNLLASENRRPVTCIIADGIFSFAIDFATEKRISIVYFRTTGACSFWAYFRMQELIEADEIPVKGKGMDLLVQSLPGTEGFLRRRDLPGFCRVDDINDPKLQGIKFETRQTARAHAAILNTFEDLEGPILSHIRTQIPNLYSIGPLHSHVKFRLETKTKEFSESLGSLWEEDRSCLTWLDSQPPKSVIYVSFGSIAIMTRDQLLEFWFGLVNSGQRFLWVMRPDSIAGNDGESQIPTELEEATKARGYTVDWAPQEEVLNHPAIGGFVTHSGWNSTIESIVAGVPMICWPYFADQMTNSRFVSEVWEIGLDMKDTCDRVVIEKMVREVMDVKKEEFLERADQLAKLARKSVSEGGSSCCNFERFVEYIRSLIL